MVSTGKTARARPRPASTSVAETRHLSADTATNAVLPDDTYRADGLVLIDMHGQIASINQAFEEMTGYHQQDLVGKEAAVVFPKIIRADDQRTARKAFSVSQTGDAPAPIAITLISRDGRDIPVLGTSSFMVDSKGKHTYIVGTFKDIASIRRTEEALRQQERFFRSLMENSSDAFVVIDAEGTEVYASPFLERVIGYRPEERAGRNMFDNIHPEDAPAVGEAFAQLLQSPGNTSLIEIRTRHKDGSWRYVEVTGKNLMDNPAVGGIAIAFRDVTARRQLHEKLRLSEEKLRNLFDTAPEGIFAIDMSGTYTEINRGLLQMYGLTSQDEVLGRDISDFIGKHEADRAADGLQGVHQERSPIDAMFWARRADGSEFPTETSASVLRDSSGNPIGIMGIVRDVSKRKQAEDRLQQTMMELERSNQELEQFAHIASHDLQEPLRMVASYVELLAERYRGQLDEKADRFIGYTVEGATRMQDMINDLLTYSRVNTRGKPFESTDCNSSLERARANLGAAIMESNAVITTDDLPAANVDHAQLAQVFQNLIGNAIKFRGESPPAIHISAQAQNDMWLFSVRDNGIGIDPRFAERIFVMFQRLNKRSKYPGTGIGLALCKKIVERHGGEIWVDSIAGEGSTFHFTIPNVGTQKDMEGYDAQ